MTSPSLTPDPESKLVPAPAPSFPGAFGAGQQEHLKVPQQQFQHDQDQELTTKPAHFPGSFVPAPEYRQPSRKPPRRNDAVGLVLNYLMDGWDNVEIWKSALIEAIATMCICYVSALIYSVIINLQTQQVAPFVGISNIFVISLFIYAVAPASGGHINPMITFATVLTGLTGFARGILYMVGQTLGAAVAGGLVRGSFGKELTEAYHGGGCLIDTSVISEGQAFLIETMLSFTAIFLAFGVGLDPRQAKLFGPRMGPFLVGCVIGLISFSSVGLAPGYVGAGLNPARCFSCAVARGSFQHQWVWWIGPLAGSVIQGFTYNLLPPYHKEITRQRKNQA